MTADLWRQRSVRGLWHRCRFGHWRRSSVIIVPHRPPVRFECEICDRVEVARLLMGAMRRRPAIEVEHWQDFEPLRFIERDR